MFPALPNDHMQVLMYKLAMAGLELPVGPVYDPDAEAYFNAYGITSETQKQNISDWYDGLKQQSQYVSLRAGWMMIADQNIGSGTILGEMKLQYEGQFINSPQWGSDGIQFNQISNTNILTNLNQPSPRTLFIISKVPNFTDFQGIGAFSVSSPDTGVGYGPDGILFSQIASGVHHPSNGAGIFDSIFFSDDGVFASSYINGQFQTGNAITNFSNQFIIGRFTNGFGTNGVIAGAFVFNKLLSEEECLSISELYYQTIGQGII